MNVVDFDFLFLGEFEFVFVVRDVQTSGLRPNSDLEQRDTSRIFHDLEGFTLMLRNKHDIAQYPIRLKGRRGASEVFVIQRAAFTNSPFLGQSYFLPFFGRSQ